MHDGSVPTIGTPRAAYGTRMATFAAAQVRASSSWPFEISGRPQHPSRSMTVTEYPRAFSTRTAARPTSGWFASVKEST